MVSLRKTLAMTAVAGLLFTVACVTINIYFPAEKVESVAGEIVNEIRGPQKQKAPGDTTSSLFRRVLALRICSVAHADEVTTVSNATIRALKDRMRSRFARMKPFYARGALKENPTGYVSLGNTAGLGLKDKRDLNGLVEAENNDRERLYREVAGALKIDPSQVQRVADIFAKEWMKSVR